MFILNIGIQLWPFSLLDEHFDLLHHVDHSNFLERILPARLSKLWADIDRLEDAIKALRGDARVCVQKTDLIGFQMLTSPLTVEIYNHSPKSRQCPS